MEVARPNCPRHKNPRRLAAAHLSGDVDRIQRAEMGSTRNRTSVAWRRDPREPGRTIMLVPRMKLPAKHGQRAKVFSDTRAHIHRHASAMPEGRNAGRRLRCGGAVTGLTASRSLGSNGRRGWRGGGG